MKPSFLTMFHEGKLLPTQLFPEGRHECIVSGQFFQLTMDSFSSFFFHSRITSQIFQNGGRTWSLGNKELASGLRFTLPTNREEDFHIGTRRGLP